jgi:hypothetical protein
MRYLLSLLPISRREADHSAGRVADVLAEMSWAEMIKTTLVTIMAMVLIPSLLLVLSVSEAWA